MTRWEACWQCRWPITLKRAMQGSGFEYTESRAGLWQAQTPQMFRTGLLVQALENAPASRRGFCSRGAGAIIQSWLSSDTTNFKVTYPQDLHMAELLLRRKN